MQELTLTKRLPGLEELGADLLVTTPQQRWLALSRPFICIIAFSVAAYLQWWWLAPIIVFLTFVVNVGIKRLMATLDTGGEVEDALLDRRLHHPLEGRGAGLLRYFSPQPTHQLNDIDSGGNSHMAQMGFAQTDIARAA
jgi:hypothetical protein